MQKHSQTKVSARKGLKLNPKWTSSLSEATATEVEKRLLENSDLFELLDQIVVKKLEASERARKSSKNYDKPGFPYLMADANGYERFGEEIRSFLKITVNGDNDV